MDGRAWQQQYRGPQFLIDRGRIRDAVARISAAAAGIEIFYPLKTNPHPEVLATVVESGCGVAISHVAEAELLRDFPASVNVGVFAPCLDPELLEHDRVRNARYMTVNSMADTDRVGESAFEGEVLIRRHDARGQGKFGCADAEAMAVCLRTKELRVGGLHVHAGTNIESAQQWRQAIAAAGAGSSLTIRNYGGGLPAQSRLDELGLALSAYLEDLAPDAILEPGRYIVDDALFCLSRILAVDDDRVFLDVGSNALPPLASSRYTVQRMIRRTGEIVESSSTGPSYALFDRGCMDITYLPRLMCAIPPETGDLVVFGRCGAYTYSLWSDFGAGRPDVTAHERLFF